MRILEAIDKAERLSQVSPVTTPTIITTLKTLSAWIESTIKLLPDSTLLKNLDLVDEWSIGESYRMGDVVVCGGCLARCVSAHTSTEETCPLHNEGHWKQITG
jgi:hypothetical protein